LRAVTRFVFVSSPLKRDAEERRWYSDRARGCLVLTSRGRLLEPYPIFGPTSYRVLACRVSAAEARAYAATHDVMHERVLL